MASERSSSLEERLLNCWPQLRDKLDVDRVPGMLIAKGILRPEWRDSVENPKGRVQEREAILLIVRQKGPNGIKTFMDVLEEVGQLYLMDAPDAGGIRLLKAAIFAPWRCIRKGYRPVAVASSDQKRISQDGSWKIIVLFCVCFFIVFGGVLAIVFLLGGSHGEDQNTEVNDVESGQDQQTPPIPSKKRIDHLPLNWNETDSHLNNQAKSSTAASSKKWEILGFTLEETGSASMSPNVKQEKREEIEREEEAEGRRNEENMDMAATFAATSEPSTPINHIDLEVTNKMKLIQEVEKTLEKWHECIGDARTKKKTAKETSRNDRERSEYWRTEAVRTQSAAAREMAVYYADAATAWFSVIEKWEAVMAKCREALLEANKDVEKGESPQTRLSNIAIRANDVKEVWIAALAATSEAKEKSSKAVKEEKMISGDHRKGEPFREPLHAKETMQ
ncbi:unnamed protein product, partial [Darwinula stevensoni]